LYCTKKYAGACRTGSRKVKHSFAKSSPTPLACMQAVFIERVEILSITTKTKTLEVKGGFYSVDDMKDELNYNQLIVLKNQHFFADTYIAYIIYIYIYYIYIIYIYIYIYIYIT